MSNNSIHQLSIPVDRKSKTMSATTSGKNYIKANIENAKKGKKAGKENVDPLISRKPHTPKDDCFKNVTMRRRFKPTSAEEQAKVDDTDDQGGTRHSLEDCPLYQDLLPQFETQSTQTVEEEPDITYNGANLELKPNWGINSSWVILTWVHVFVAAGLTLYSVLKY